MDSTVSTNVPSRQFSPGDPLSFHTLRPSLWAVGAQKYLVRWKNIEVTRFISDFSFSDARSFNYFTILHGAGTAVSRGWPRALKKDDSMVKPILCNYVKI